MEFQSYNEELAVAQLLFKNLFSNIRIGRTDDRGRETQINVTCILGQRSRILKGLENPDKRGNYKLPMIVISRTGYARNGDRLNNLHNEVKYELTSTLRKYHLLAPVPVDINFDVSIISKYPSDIDKIASNFMVFFNSDLYVSCEHPKYAGVQMNNQVIMSDSVSEEHNDEIDASAEDLTIATFQFTFKTFLFGGCEKYNKAPVKIDVHQVSSVLSDVVVEIPPSGIDQFQKENPDKEVSAIVVLSADQIDDFQLHYPDSPVSAMMPSVVTCDYVVPIDNPETSVDVEVYNDIPIIQNINCGFYVVPGKHEIIPYIQSVDNGDFGEHREYDLCGYISSDEYISPPPTVHHNPYDPYDTPTSSFNEPLSGDPDYDEVVDTSCSLAPYVDKLYWRIDNNLSTYTYPNNVIWQHAN